MMDVKVGHDELLLQEKKINKKVLLKKICKVLFCKKKFIENKFGIEVLKKNKILVAIE